MKILIIEDELYTAKDLERTICEVHPAAEIVEILPSVEESVAFLKTQAPIDLIFSDIQLNDGLSFEIFQQVSHSAPIVFCTAFDQYALEAFNTHSIDYILKPFERETVKKAIDKYQQLRQPAQPDLEAITQAITARLFTPQKTSIIVHKGEKYIPMPLEDIALFFIKHEIVWAYTLTGEKYVINKKMDSLEASYAPAFFRANRQHLIHRVAVKDAAQHFKRKLLVNLKVPFEDQILVGKVKTKAFLDWLSHH